MPQFKVAKATNKTNITNNPITTDKLYIYKETDKFGRIFYDFDENTRIEIGSLDNVYTTTSELSKNIEILNVDKLQKFSSTMNLEAVNISEIQINSFVIYNTSIYNIRYIDRDKSEVILARVFKQDYLVWNDYYGS